MKKTLGVMGIGILSAALAGCPDSAPTDQEKDAKQQQFAELADQCESQARNSPDGDNFKDRKTASNNLSEYTQGEPFDLQVSLQGQGNTFLQLNCRVDAQGNVSYQNYEEMETAAGSGSTTDNG